MNEKLDLAVELSEGYPRVDLKNDLVKALRGSEENFRLLVSLLPINLVVLRGGIIVYANPGLLHLLGYGMSEKLAGRPFLPLIPPEFHEKIQNRIQNITEKDGASNPAMELKLFLKKGGTVPVEGESVAVIYQGVSSVMVLIHDITERKKAQESQKNSDNNFKSIIQQIPDGIFIENLERILFVSQSVVRMLGYEKEEELIGRPPLSFVHPDYHPLVQKRVARIYGHEEVQPLLESEWLRKDGSRLAVEASSISITYDGQPAVMAVLRDTAPRKEAEKALRQSDANFKSIIDQMPDGVLIVDEEKVLFANPILAGLLKWEAGEMRGRPTLDFVHPDFHEIIQSRVSRIITKGGANPLLKLKMLSRGERAVDFESSSISIQFEGQPAVMAVLRDITQQIQVDRQRILNEKLATVGTLAAGIAHEINNPLTYVLANLVFLKENFDDLRRRMAGKNCMDEACLGLFKEILEEMKDTTEGGERIRDIVRGLKSFVNTNENEVMEIHLNQMVESAINMTFNEFKHKARLEKDFGLHLPVLTVNPGKLQQVFINLLVNAAQAIGGHNPEDHKIRIRTGQQNGSLFVEFTDTGKGIPPEVLPWIFDPFFTTKAIGVGTGLGLSICEEIVRGYQGVLEVQSQEGIGTTFTVRLPLENGRKVTRPGVVLPSAAARGRILIVDDEPGNLEVLSRILKKKNDVLSALSGLDALAILEREKGLVDSIVSDLNMPDMDGMTLYQKVSEKFPGLEKRFVFITGGIFTPPVRDFLETISNPCLEKPFRFEDLLGAVSQWTGASITPLGMD